MLTRGGAVAFDVASGTAGKIRSMADHESPISRLEAPPVFIVGMHRSGTTWAYELLASHPEVAGVFESGLFSADLGIAPLFSPVHWYEGEVRGEDERLFGARFRLSQLLTRAQALSEVRELTASWLGRVIQPRHRYLVEKTPQHVYSMRLIAELFPGCAFIHVIRDGRDVAVSVEQAGRSWPRGRVRSAELSGVAQRWAAAVLAGRRAADLGFRYTEVRFEQLKEQPEQELARLFDFCGIEATDELVSSLAAGAAIEARRSAGGDVFRRRGYVGSWKKRFSMRERLHFDRAAGALLVELGYERNRRWWLPRPLGR